MASSELALFTLAGLLTMSCAPATSLGGAATPSPAEPTPSATPLPDPASAAAPAASNAAASESSTANDVVSITIQNPIALTRARETISVSLGDLRKVVPTLDLTQTLVVRASGEPVLSQLVDSDDD